MQNVCIVEDDDAVRDALAELVESDGYRVLSYASAEEFVAGADATQVDVLIVDFRLPGMSGGELLKRLNERGMRLPVILMTGHADCDEVGLGLDVQDVSFLTKPCDPRRLLGLIGAAVDGKG